MCPCNSTEDVKVTANDSITKNASLAEERITGSQHCGLVDNVSAADRT